MLLAKIYISLMKTEKNTYQMYRSLMKSDKNMYQMFIGLLGCVKYKLTWKVNPKYICLPTITIVHCDHVNDFPVVNGTPGIIQDLLLAKCNFRIKRSMVLDFSTCNTVDLLLAKCNFPNKRSTVLVFSTCNTVDLSVMKLLLLF